MDVSASDHGPVQSNGICLLEFVVLARERGDGTLDLAGVLHVNGS